MRVEKDLEKHIRLCMLAYPRQFRCRYSVLKHLFISYGTGYEWEDGYLRDTCGSLSHKAVHADMSYDAYRRFHRDYEVARLREQESQGRGHHRFEVGLRLIHLMFNNPKEFTMLITKKFTKNMLKSESQAKTLKEGIIDLMKSEGFTCKQANENLRNTKRVRRLVGNKIKGVVKLYNSEVIKTRKGFSNIHKKRNYSFKEVSTYTYDKNKGGRLYLINTYACEYSPILNFPDDVKSNYLDGIIEVCEETLAIYDKYSDIYLMDRDRNTPLIKSALKRAKELKESRRQK